ncbi:tRNA lysidine(34) synthetase TilS [Candidatus Uabimicrobium sp. HlEnr_7]|uniref:tRNA lysidine(34) synthetase TilS n=1 Tax=Candidatus Uabimicrobium helgolandensis TaxID=3095367 RepID=UPI0035584553
MLIKQVIGNIESHSLIKKDDRIVIAVSGGADSIALLYILLELRSQYTLHLSIAHLDHGLRNSSFDEAHSVALLAKSLKLPFYTRCENLLISGDKGIEERARNARYTFLNKCAIKFKANSIAVAHHANDQAETLLFNMIRGSGITGLAGILYKRSVSLSSSIQIIRPLLSLPKQELIDYLSDKKWIEDESNKDTSFTRNKIRIKLVPFLQKNFSSNILQSLNKITVRCQGIVNFMHCQADDCYEKTKTSLCSKTHLDEFIKKTLLFEVFDSEAFSNIPPEIIPFFLKKVLMLMQVDVSVYEHHYAMIEKLKGQLSGEVYLSKQVIICKKSQKIYIYQRKNIEYTSDQFTNKLCVNNTTFEFRKYYDDNYNRDVFTQIIDMDKLCLPLQIRTWNSSDLMKPLGAPGKKKIQKILKDIKLHEPFRHHIPIVVDDNNRVVWLVGVCIANSVRVTDKTLNKAMLHLL